MQYLNDYEGGKKKVISVNTKFCHSREQTVLTLVYHPLVPPKRKSCLIKCDYFPAPVEKSKEESSASNSIASGKSNYVPPHLRNQVVTRERPTRSKPGAPDITNQEYFPTLSAASSESAGSWNRR